jgi:hypothetical protein
MTGHYDLTEKDKENLKQFSNTLSEFASLKSGETVDWEFNPKDIQQVTDTYGRQKIQFRIYDPDLDHEFKWNAPKAAAKQVLTLLQQGKNFLRVHREGSSQQDTRYSVEEIKS